MRPTSIPQQGQTFTSNIQNSINNRNTIFQSEKGSKKKSKYKPSLYSAILCMLFLRRIKKSIKKR
jgi:hypothetical protein